MTTRPTPSRSGHAGIALPGMPRFARLVIAVLWCNRLDCHFGRGFQYRGCLELWQIESKQTSPMRDCDETSSHPDKLINRAVRRTGISRRPVLPPIRAEEYTHFVGENQDLRIIRM